MAKVFQLYDCITEKHLSLHSTIAGAVIAMSGHVASLAPAMANDYGEDSSVEFDLRYTVKSFEVVE